MTGVSPDSLFDEYLARISTPATRPTFAADELVLPQSAQLAAGPAEPPLIGVPSTVALCGPHQYLDFAKRFRARRDVHALGVPGFVAGEHLPADVTAAAEAEAEAVLRCAGGRPPVIAGYSSGGTLAYGIAALLERRGNPVSAVVLIDAYPFSSVSSHDDRTRALLRKMFDDKQLRQFLTGIRLSAMAWYVTLFTDWQLEPISAPTLLLRPTDPMPGMAADSAWEAVWPYPHDTVRVPGDHWTMMMQHADSTAAAVESWLERGGSQAEQ